MDNHDKSDSRWDELTVLLRQMRDGLERALAEAQRRFATAPDEPFSTGTVRLLAAAAKDRGIGSEDPVLRDVLTDLIFTSDANAATNDVWPEGFWGPLCGIVGWHPWMVMDTLMTDVNSTSVDTRALRWSRVPREMRGGVGTDPIVLDVWPGFDELAARQIRKVREGTVRSDACLDSAGSENLGYAVDYSTSFDFVDYDDEAIKELLRN